MAQVAPPSGGTKKRNKPRFLPGCEVLFEETEGGNLVTGKVIEMLKPTTGGSSISYQIRQNNFDFRLPESQLRFSADSPVWVETKLGNKPGHVDRYDPKEGKYQVKMLADGKIVKKIPPHSLWYNGLQAVIQKAYETQALIKREAIEDEGQQQEEAAHLPLVKQEMQEEEDAPTSNGATANDETSPEEADFDLLVSDGEGSDDDDDDNEDTATNNRKLMSEEEHLESRKRDLPRNRILNESPNLFFSIEYSPKHDIPGAIKTIQTYIQDYGAVSGRRQHGGIGPVLYRRCLNYHIQGQCWKHGCQFQEDHIALKQTEATAIEAALEPAFTAWGPIYTPEVVLAVKKEEEADKEQENDDDINNNTQYHQSRSIEQPTVTELPVRRDPRQRPQHREVLESTTNKTASTIPTIRQDPRKGQALRRQRDNTDNNNDKNSNNASSTLKEKRQRRFKCSEQISLILPASFGESFYRRALYDSTEAKEIQQRYYDHDNRHGSCEWELECSNNGRSIRVTTQGDDYNQMEQYHDEIPQLLCRRLLPQQRHLRGKLLWDIKKLAGNTNRDEHFLSIQDKGCARLLLDEKDETPSPTTTTCWITVIPLTETPTVPNQSLDIQYATVFADKLRAAYYNSCCIGVHLAAGGGGGGGRSASAISNRQSANQDFNDNFSSVPSHIVIWSRNQSTVRQCRTDFFRQAESADDADEAW